MNKQRKKEIKEIGSKLDELASRLADLRSEEYNAYIKLPVSILTGRRGDAMQDAIDSMDGAIDNLNEAIGLLEQATE